MIGCRHTIVAVACVVAATVSWAGAAELEEIHSRGELIWAADQEGGGPHVFPDPADPRRLSGFEVEFAKLLAGELGVKARFQQGQWDRLPLLLDQSADCVINGLRLLASLLWLCAADGGPPRRATGDARRPR